VTIRFKIYKGQELVATRDLDDSIIKVGRMPSAHLCLPDSTVARMQAVLEVVKGQITVIDLGSASGTLLNGQKVAKAAVNYGDELRMGNMRIVVEDASTGGEDLEEVGRRLATVRDAAQRLVREGKMNEAVELVRSRAGIGDEEAKAYADGLRGT
jgi:pSer/pThr/pTyr-binding forkhead associated (FHA) protein